MKKMFESCSNLESLDLSNFDTSNVTNMEDMFYKCNILKQIKGINNFKTFNVTTMKGMFQECKELEYLDLSNFDLSNVKDMREMFKMCHNLKEIKGINKFNMVNNAQKEEIFAECNKLENDIFP